MMIDVHFHPLPGEMDSDVAGIMRRAKEAGIAGAIACALDAPTCETMVALAHDVPGLAAAVGYHPWYLREKVDTARLERYLDDPAVVALGEIGLDGKIEIPMATQEEAFAAQLELARRRSVPVIIHSRGAFQKTLDAVRPFAGIAGVFHSFGGSTETAKELLDLGYSFSFSGTVTRPAARKVHRLASYVPDDRILLETDAPSIGMEGVPPEKVEPAHARLVAEALAARRGVPVGVIAELTTRNALSLFPKLERILDDNDR